MDGALSSRGRNMVLRCLAPLLTLGVGLTVATVPQCGGDKPQKSPALRYGCDQHYGTAEHICCNNHRYAEPFGFLSTAPIQLFSQLDASGTTVFYDSVCGAPLFVAPRGRSFDAWKQESTHHGWPSFRPEEMTQNVRILPGGRMESVCGTHLGHNLPDGRDRYCIDLVCVAGSPTTAPHRAFNATAFTSVQPQHSGLEPRSYVAPALGLVGGVALLWAIIIAVKRARRQQVRVVGASAAAGAAAAAAAAAGGKAQGLGQQLVPQGEAAHSGVIM